MSYHQVDLSAGERTIDAGQQLIPNGQANGFVYSAGVSEHWRRRASELANWTAMIKEAGIEPE